MQRSSLNLSLAVFSCSVLMLGGCCLETQAWQTGRRDVVGATPVVVPSPAWPEVEATTPALRTSLHHPEAELRRAVAIISPTEGNNARGAVRFEDTEQGLHVVADLQNLPPSSTLGFHIHEFGDISAPDGMSAGGHYNPGGHQHAGPDQPMRHAGDLGNIQSDAAGNAKLDITVTGVSLIGENPVLGRAVVVHSKADDLKSQPTGNAGARIGVGVIGMVKQ